jgi:hypothetical protein
MTPSALRRRIGSSSTIACGSGEATTRRQDVPSRATAHPAPFPAACAAAWLAYAGPIGLDLRQDRDHLAPGRRVAEFLREHVADHAVGLRTEDVERRRGLSRGGLEGEQSDLRPVAVRDDQLVSAGELRQRAGRDTRVGALRR